MIKKLVTITILVALMVALASCNSEEAVDSPTSNDIAQPEYSELIDAGWKYQEGSYVYAGINEECNYECSAAIDADHKSITIELRYNYLNGDYNIVEMYKNDDSIAVGLASTWMGNVISVIDADIETLNYEIFVGDQMVGNGEIDADEAQKIAAEYNSY